MSFAPSEVGPPDRRAVRRRAVLCVLCALAAARVAFFSLALPFGNNLDEPEHYDLARKMARGSWPASAREPFDPDVVRLLARYTGFEFSNAPDELGGAIPPPAWERSAGDARAFLARREAYWSRHLNHEALSPPVYYALAATGLRAGRALGVVGIADAYALRLANAGLVVLLVLAAYRFCRLAFPGRTELELGVPALVAVLPNDAFYTVTSDALSPLLFTAALIVLLRWSREASPSHARSGVAGGLVALAFLTKLTNLALPGVFAVLLWRRLRAGGARAAGVAAGAALLPVALWCARNVSVVGDWTGAREKAALLGWTPLAPSAWLSHPIFGPSGAAEFLAELVRTFWRGKIRWHGEPLAHAWADATYLAVTVVALAGALLWAWRERRKPDRGAGDALPWLLWGPVVGSAGVLAALSVPWDYGDCRFPSAEHPYLSAGRLALGALVPFAVLFVLGLETWLQRIVPAKATLAVLVVLGVVATASEILLLAGPLESAYAWSRIPGR